MIERRPSEYVAGRKRCRRKEWSGGPEERDFLDNDSSPEQRGGHGGGTEETEGNSAGRRRFDRPNPPAFQRERLEFQSSRISFPCLLTTNRDRGMVIDPYCLPLAKPPPCIGRETGLPDHRLPHRCPKYSRTSYRISAERFLARTRRNPISVPKLSSGSSWFFEAYLDRGSLRRSRSRNTAYFLVVRKIRLNREADRRSQGRAKIPDRVSSANVLRGVRQNQQSINWQSTGFRFLPRYSSLGWLRPRSFVRVDRPSASFSCVGRGRAMLAKRGATR